MNATINRMSQKPAKPQRMVRIPEPMAVALEKMAEKQFNSLTEQVKIAVREYLERHDNLPDPSSPGRPPRKS